MSSITIELDNEVASLLGATDQSASAAARELLVMELYRLGRLSTEKSASVLGMNRLSFLNRASDLGVSYLQLSPGELEADLNVARTA